MNSYILEKITIENISDYHNILPVMKNICKYSEYDPYLIDLVSEVKNPSLPEKGESKFNNIIGIKSKENNDVIAWIKFYENYKNSKTIFLGE